MRNKVNTKKMNGEIKQLEKQGLRRGIDFDVIIKEEGETDEETNDKLLANRFMRKDLIDIGNIGKNIHKKAPRHGSGEVEIEKTTDHVHGICPKCKTSEGYGRMLLSGEVILGRRTPEERGRIILPLICQKCGYEDAIKMETLNCTPIKLEFE